MAAIFLSSHSDIYIHKSRCIACWKRKQRRQWNKRLQFLRTIFEINNYVYLFHRETKRNKQVCLLSKMFICYVILLDADISRFGTLVNNIAVNLLF